MNFSDYLNRNKKTSIISKGYKLNGSFWNDFQSLLNSSDELSILLDIPKNKISTWRKKIQNSIDEYQKEQQQSINKKRRVLKTGKLKN